MTLPHSRSGASEALLGASSRDFGGRPELTAAFWDEARGDLPPAERSIRWVLVLGALARIAVLVVLFNLLVG